MDKVNGLHRFHPLTFDLAERLLRLGPARLRRGEPMRRLRAIAICVRLVIGAVRCASDGPCRSRCLQVLGSVTSATRPVGNALVIALNLNNLDAIQTFSGSGRLVLAAAASGRRLQDHRHEVRLRCRPSRRSFRPSRDITSNCGSKREAGEQAPGSARCGRSARLAAARHPPRDRHRRWRRRRPMVRSDGDYDMPRFRGEMVSMTGVRRRSTRPRPDSRRPLSACRAASATTGSSASAATFIASKIRPTTQSFGTPVAESSACRWSCARRRPIRISVASTQRVVALSRRLPGDRARRTSVRTTSSGSTATRRVAGPLPRAAESLRRHARIGSDRDRRRHDACADAAQRRRRLAARDAGKPAQHTGHTADLPHRGPHRQREVRARSRVHARLRHVEPRRTLRHRVGAAHGRGVEARRRTPPSSSPACTKSSIHAAAEHAAERHRLVRRLAPSAALRVFVRHRFGRRRTRALSAIAAASAPPIRRCASSSPTASSISGTASTSMPATSAATSRLAFRKELGSHLLLDVSSMAGTAAPAHPASTPTERRSSTWPATSSRRSHRRARRWPFRTARSISRSQTAATLSHASRRRPRRAVAASPARPESAPRRRTGARRELPHPARRARLGRQHAAIHRRPGRQLLAVPSA